MVDMAILAALMPFSRKKLIKRSFVGAICRDLRLKRNGQVIGEWAVQHASDGRGNLGWAAAGGCDAAALFEGWEEQGQRISDKLFRCAKL